MSDDRAAPRHRIFKAGLIEFPGQAIEYIVRNLSASGAALEVQSPLWLPDRFFLSIASEGLRKSCQIVWASERRMGVLFEEQSVD